MKVKLTDIADELEMIVDEGFTFHERFCCY